MTNSPGTHSSILQRIGNTSLIQLDAIVPADCSRTFLKVEAENPTGSMTDRMASGGATGTHKIEGVGAGFVVPLWNLEAIDELAVVSTDEAMATARRLARDEGLFAGTSTGGNVAAAIQLGRRLGPDATVVTVMCDSGIKYLSTHLYSRN